MSLGELQDGGPRPGLTGIVPEDHPCAVSRKSKHRHRRPGRHRRRLGRPSPLYSIDFYERLGHYARVGGLEVARVGDDARMEEIKRRVSSGKAFGTRSHLVTPAEIKAKFPLIEESMV